MSEVIINVKEPQTKTSINIPKISTSTSTDIVGDKYYVDLAKDWAIKTDGKVLGEDYSSKYYATQANQSIDEFIENLAVENNLEVTKDGRSVTIKNPTFEFEQGIASDTWIIEHNMDKCPSVIVVDSAGIAQMPNEIEYNNENKITLYFLSPFAGKAYLN